MHSCLMEVHFSLRPDGLTNDWCYHPDGNSLMADRADVAFAGSLSSISAHHNQPFPNRIFPPNCVTEWEVYLMVTMLVGRNRSAWLGYDSVPGMKGTRGSKSFLLSRNFPRSFWRHSQYNTRLMKVKELIVPILSQLILHAWPLKWLHWYLPRRRSTYGSDKTHQTLLYKHFCDN